jgi:hypothetical protein
MKLALNKTFYWVAKSRLKVSAPFGARHGITDFLMASTTGYNTTGIFFLAIMYHRNSGLHIPIDPRRSHSPCPSVLARAPSPAQSITWRIC